jgi:GTP-binding protein
MKITDAAFVKSAGDWGGLPGDGVAEAAFVGRSNVGKSTLLNALVGRKDLAFTSNQPGRTRTFNVYRAERSGGGGPFHLIDVPGLGYAKVSKKERERWEHLIARYLAARAPLRLVLHLIDSRHEPQPVDRDLFHFLGGQRVPYLAVLTKADKLKKNERTPAVRRLKEALLEAQLEAPVVLTSAEKGDGLKEVRAWIGDLVR